MKGRIEIRIRNNKNDYSFVLKRNITILCGESGSGKSTLYRMVDDFSQEGKLSGVRVQITDNHDITVLEGRNWRDELEKIRNSVVLVDEDSSFLRSEDFAEAVRGSSNYYLLITRAYLYQLPYSVEEIYVVRGRKKKHFEKLWKNREQMYHEPWLGRLPFKPELVITEDSNSGFEFFENICRKTGIECISAHGKSNILRLVKENDGKNTAVIADGAAFGAEIEELAELQRSRDGMIALFLPESFEWLLLRSGLITREDLPEVLQPEDFADSERYFSWEQYFAELLIRKSAEKAYGKYSKDRLNPFYKTDSSVARILVNVKGLHF